MKTSSGCFGARDDADHIAGGHVGDGGMGVTLRLSPVIGTALKPGLLAAAFSVA